MKEHFECPECGSRFERNAHYLGILEQQNMINLIMGNPKAVDMCGKCNLLIEEIVQNNETGK